MSVELSIVVPAYDEADRLPVLLEALPHHIDLQRTEVIVVDDGSTDGTAELARQRLAEFPYATVLGDRPNAGKGAALRRGVAAATGAQLLIMDADMATDLAAVGPVLSALDSADVAVGSRSLPDSVVHDGSHYRRWMGQVFNHLLRLVTKVRVSDSQCGFKAFRGPVARQLFAMSERSGYGQDAELLDFAARLGFTVVEVPVTWTNIAGSKVRPLRDSALTALEVLQHRVRIRRMGLVDDEAASAG